VAAAAPRLSSPLLDPRSASTAWGAVGSDRIGAELAADFWPRMEGSWSWSGGEGGEAEGPLLSGGESEMWRERRRRRGTRDVAPLVRVFFF